MAEMEPPPGLGPRDRWTGEFTWRQAAGKKVTTTNYTITRANGEVEELTKIETEGPGKTKTVEFVGVEEGKQKEAASRDITGKYIRVTGGADDRGTETLEIRADGTLSYTNEKKTAIQDLHQGGEGTWKVEGVKDQHVNMVCRLTTTITPKLVAAYEKKKGIGLEPRVETEEGANPFGVVSIDDLANAKTFGTNRWRRA